MGDQLGWSIWMINLDDQRDFGHRTRAKLKTKNNQDQNTRICRTEAVEQNLCARLGSAGKNLFSKTVEFKSRDLQVDSKGRPSRGNSVAPARQSTERLWLPCGIALWDCRYQQVGSWCDRQSVNKLRNKEWSRDCKGAGNTFMAVGGRRKSGEDCGAKRFVRTLSNQLHIELHKKKKCLCSFEILPETRQGSKKFADQLLMTTAL